jgi:hypothetical protein
MSCLSTKSLSISCHRTAEVSVVNVVTPSTNTPAYFAAASESFITPAQCEPFHLSSKTVLSRSFTFPDDLTVSRRDAEVSDGLNENVGPIWRHSTSLAGKSSKAAVRCDVKCQCYKTSLRRRWRNKLERLSLQSFF